MVPPPSTTHPRPPRRYSFSEHSWHPYSIVYGCNCCMPRRAHLYGRKLCRLVAGIFIANFCLFLIVAEGDIILALITAAFMTLIATVMVAIILRIFYTIQSCWRCAFAKRFALYYFCCCIARVDVPPETLWDVASFLPRRSPLWRTNRLFALRIITSACYGRYYICQLLTNNQYWIKDIDSLHSPPWLILWSSKQLREMVAKECRLKKWVAIKNSAVVAATQLAPTMTVINVNKVVMNNQARKAWTK